MIRLFALVVLTLSALSATSWPAVAQSGATRDARYCEILPAYPAGDRQLRLDVYNTLGYNDCPADWWASLDPDQIAEENGAVGTVLNGPRYFVMDQMTAEGESQNGAVKTFNGQQAQYRASLNKTLRSLIFSKPYTTSTIDRQTDYLYKAGLPTYRLTDATGKVYIMQTYSQQVDPTLTMDQLASLGGRLKLPKGWAYTVVTPTADLHAVANGEATLIQDDLMNSYQLLN